MNSALPNSRYNTAATAVLAAVVAWSYGPQLVEFAANTWEYRQHYQHFPFVLLAAVLLFAQQLQSPNSGTPPSRWWALTGTVVAWVLLAAGHLIISPVLTAASAVLLAGAVGVVIARWLNVPFPTGPWTLLWLVIPPPVGLDGRMIEAMQRQSSVLASFALDTLQVNHLMDGNALVLPSKTLFVDEACSGIISAVSIVTCAAMYGVWRRRSLVKTLTLMVLSAGWAVLMNVVRITAIALAEAYAGWNLADGFAHTLVGLGGFAFALLTIFLTDWFVTALFAPIGDRWGTLTGEPIRFGESLVGAWDYMVGDYDAEPAMPKSRRRWEWRRLTGGIGLSTALATSVAFASIGTLDLVAPAKQEQSAVNFPEADDFAKALQASGVMPERTGDLRLESVEHQQRDTSSLFAAHSVVYVYSDDSGKRYLVSCDFPYAGGWHELSVCYRGIGWRLDGREVQQIGSAKQELPRSVPHDAAFLDLTRPDGTTAIVAFCGSFADGEPVPAPAMTLQESLWNAFSRRGAVERRNSYQTQVLTEDAVAISDRRREECQRLLETAHAVFAREAEALIKPLALSDGTALD